MGNEHWTRGVIAFNRLKVGAEGEEGAEAWEEEEEGTREA